MKCRHDSRLTLVIMQVAQEPNAAPSIILSGAVSTSANATIDGSEWTANTALRVAYRSIVVLGLLCLTTFALLVRRLTAQDAIMLAQRCARRILRVAGTTVVIQGHPSVAAGLTVCNHRSYLDIVVLLSASPCTFLCKNEIRRWPLIGKCATQMGAVFVDRSNKASRAESRMLVARALANGVRLAAFPEGTTTRGPGMREIRPGLFLAAEQHGFNILPAVIEYADPEDAWIDDDTLLRHCAAWLAKPRSVVTLRFGTMLDPAPSGLPLHQRAETWMRAALQEINTYRH